MEILIRTVRKSKLYSVQYSTVLDDEEINGIAWKAYYIASLVRFVKGIIREDQKLHVGVSWRKLLYRSKARLPGIGRDWLWLRLWLWFGQWHQNPRLSRSSAGSIHSRRGRAFVFVGIKFSCRIEGKILLIRGF